MSLFVQWKIKNLSKRRKLKKLIVHHDFYLEISKFALLCAVSSPITESSSPSSVSEGTTPAILTESTTSPSISTTQSTIFGDYTCPSPNGLFPDPSGCAKFYQCSNDVAYPNVNYHYIIFTIELNTRL